MDLIEQKKCIICYDDISIKKKLLKICNCMDSLLCEECYIIFNEKHIEKCPVCKTKLKYNVKHFYFNNLYIYLKKNKLIIFNIFINLIVINLIINYKYFKNSNYPIIRENDIFYFNDYIKLKNYVNFLNYFIYYKKTYFLIINIVNLVIYPLSYFCLNLAIYNTSFQIKPYISKLNKLQLYLNIGIQLLITYILLFANNSFIYLKLYVILIFVIYSMITILFLLLFLMIIVFKNYKYIKNNNMITHYNLKINNVEEYQGTTLENDYLLVSAV